MKAIFILTLILSGVVSTKTYSHEGQDHDAPTTLKAPKGGVIKALDESRVEVVSKGKDVKIYFYDKTMKPLVLSRFKVLAKAELPRTGRQETLALIDQSQFFEASYDAKGVHRYTLKLSITDTAIGRTENLNFTVEPRK
jgi:hypothetical protein